MPVILDSSTCVFSRGTNLQLKNKRAVDVSFKMNKSATEKKVKPDCKMK